ncbi:HU family DNA-binding protein [Peribacillus butanolivorans]|uniref:HU family DNA-binding protein n=1 Tax=Peribacillus butanolivorans TaxID=421767 RepID=UPI00399C7229
MSSSLIRFGTFEVRDRAARTRNPHTGVEYKLLLPNFPAFKPEKEKRRLKIKK